MTYGNYVYLAHTFPDKAVVRAAKKLLCVQLRRFQDAEGKSVKRLRFDVDAEFPFRDQEGHWHLGSAIWWKGDME